MKNEADESGQMKIIIIGGLGSVVNELRMDEVDGVHMMR